MAQTAIECHETRAGPAALQQCRADACRSSSEWMRQNPASDFCIAEGQNIAIWNGNDEPVWSEMGEVFVPSRIDVPLLDILQPVLLIDYLSDQQAVAEIGSDSRIEFRELFCHFGSRDGAQEVRHGPCAEAFVQHAHLSDGLVLAVRTRRLWSWRRLACAPCGTAPR